LTLGNAIKVVRTAGGIKQRALAKKLGVSANYISLIESGKRDPSISFLNRLADALGIPVGVFFLWQEVETGSAGVAHLDKIRQLLTRLEAMYLMAKREKARRKKRVA
jgi:transcriptional regulator with XRE-family HTH domain